MRTAARLSATALAGLALLAAITCGDDPLAPFQPEITNIADNFEFQATGASLPPQVEVKYTDASAGDFCRVITPGASVEVPFSSAHPGCSTSSSSVTDAVDLTYIRLVFPRATSAYALDFCLTIRAIP